MDIAAMSVVMANKQVRADAGLAVLNHAKNLTEQQGNQLVEMLQQSNQKVDHPSLGTRIDLNI
ncbi:YjfB family protein [Virgibacillus sp. W0181]|uniref:YjfB family protein n=1 Tax=Virgibacillus sp. W0181 TaxID=3391581 RepID=UPI003F46561C